MFDISSQSKLKLRKRRNKIVKIFANEDQISKTATVVNLINIINEFGEFPQVYCSHLTSTFDYFNIYTLNYFTN